MNENYFLSYYLCICIYSLLQRFFILDKGVLTYGKGPSEIARGKIHGQVDIGLSVISTKGKRKRIDIDADEFIHHLKVGEFVGCRIVM